MTTGMTYPLKRRFLDRVIVFRDCEANSDLYKLAAKREGVTASNFIRQALREKATRVLLETDKVPAAPR